MKTVAGSAGSDYASRNHVHDVCVENYVNMVDETRVVSLK